MKKLLLIALVAGGLTLVAAPRLDAQLSFSVGYGFPGYYYYYGYYPYGYYYPYRSYTYYQPYYSSYYRPYYWYGGHRYHHHYRHHYYHHNWGDQGHQGDQDEQ